MDTTVRSTGEPHTSSAWSWGMSRMSYELTMERYTLVRDRHGTVVADVRLREEDFELTWKKRGVTTNS